MNVKLSNKDYLWSYLGVAVSVCTYVIITPFALYFLSDDFYGLWGVFQSLVAITTLFDFGFSTTFARNINYCWNGANELKKEGVTYSESLDPNFELMKKTMAACKQVFLVISGIALILMLTIGSVYIVYVSRGIEGFSPIIAWAIYAIAIFMNIYYGYFNSFLRGVGAIKFANQATVLARMSQIIIAVILLFMGGGIIGTAVAYLAYGVLFRLLGKKYFYQFNNIGDSLKKINKEFSRNDVNKIFTVVWHNASKEGVVTLANYLANQACTIICSLYLTLAVTGVYSLAVQICTAISNVSATLYSANQPVLQAAYISNNKGQTKRTMSLIVISYVLVFFICMSAAVIIGIPIIKIIKPDINLTAKLLLGTGLYQFILKLRNCYTSYFSCTNRILYAKSFIISSLLCVILAFFNTKVFGWGVGGLIIAQLISQCIYNAWYWLYKAHQEMELSFIEMIILGLDEIKKILNNFFQDKIQWKGEMKC